MWLDSDQDEVLGYLREHRRTCPGCGIHDDDKADVVPVFVRCSTCEQQEDAQASLEEGTRGVRVSFEPIAVARAREEAAEPDDGDS